MALQAYPSHRKSSHDAKQGRMRRHRPGVGYWVTLLCLWKPTKTTPAIVPPRAFCRRQPGASATPPAAAVRSRILKIAQPLMAGFTVHKPSQSRQGRQVLAHGHYLRTATIYFFRPGRDFVASRSHSPSLERLGYFQTHPRLFAVARPEPAPPRPPSQSRFFSSGPASVPTGQPEISQPQGGWSFIPNVIRPEGTAANQRPFRT